MPTNAEKLEYVGVLRTEAAARLSAVVAAIKGASSDARTRILGSVRTRWLGTITEDQLTKNLEVLADFIGAPDRFLMDLTSETAKYIAMVAGRPSDSGRPMATLAYPGLAGTLTGTGVAPGMSFNPKYLKPGNASNREDRIWTVVHEASHALLGTYDYQYYDFTAVITDASGQKTRKSVIKSTLRKDLSNLTIQRNADSYGAFLCQATKTLTVTSTSETATRATPTVTETEATHVVVVEASPEAVQPPQTCTKCTSRLPLLNGRTVCPICERRASAEVRS